MKQAAIGVLHDGGIGLIEDKKIPARRFTLIAAEPQQAVFVIGQTLRRRREMSPPGQPADQTLSGIVNPPHDPPRPVQKCTQITDGMKHTNPLGSLFTGRPPIAKKRQQGPHPGRS